MSPSRILPLLPTLLFACTGPTPEQKLQPKQEVVKKEAPVPAANGCEFPTRLSADPNTNTYQAMWQIFVAANCSAQAPNDKYGPLVWENWVEQGCLVGTDTCSQLPSATPRRILRHSVAMRATTLKGTEAVNPFFKDDCAGEPYCEEVTTNAAEETFIKAGTLQTTNGQLAYAMASQTSPPINMPTDAVEVKAGWAKISDGACAGTNELHVETFTDAKGAAYCYGLVGMHVSSKLLPNWIWSTFEPQSASTNPARCLPPTAPAPTGQTTPASGQYGPCNDPWGSNPAVNSSPAPTEATAQLQAVFASAGARLPTEFQNYRMDGTQTTFLTSTNAPTLLGNSRIEGAASVPSGASSCITCHSNAMVGQVNGKAVDNPFTSAMLSGVGAASPVPPSYYLLDFSWMLGITQKQGN